tara:strand:- start:23 stop:301 length:279 start_codon:yes stop_codon:yes gene_type:complete
LDPSSSFIVSWVRPLSCLTVQFRPFAALLVDRIAASQGAELRGISVACSKSVGVLQSVLQLVVIRNDRAEHAFDSILVIPLQIWLLASDFDL